MSETYRGYFLDEGANSIVFLPGADAVNKVLVGPTKSMRELIDVGEGGC